MLIRLCKRGMAVLVLVELGLVLWLCCLLEVCTLLRALFSHIQFSAVISAYKGFAAGAKFCMNVLSQLNEPKAYWSCFTFFGNGLSPNVFYFYMFYFNSC